MVTKLHSKHPLRVLSGAPRLSVTADKIAWIRDLASSVRLSPPADDASPAALKQYAWNAAIFQAIAKIAERLLTEGDDALCERIGPRVHSGQKSDAPLA